MCPRGKGETFSQLIYAATSERSAMCGNQKQLKLNSPCCVQEAPLSVKTWRWCQQVDWGLGVAKGPGAAGCVAFKAVRLLWLSISTKHIESRNKDYLWPFLVCHPRKSDMPCSCVLFLTVVTVLSCAEVTSMMLRLEGSDWQCSICHVVMKRTNLYFHIEAKHIDSSGHECQQCGKFCSTLKALSVHRSKYQHR